MHTLTGTLRPDLSINAWNFLLMFLLAGPEVEPRRAIACSLVSRTP